MRRRGVLATLGIFVICALSIFSCKKKDAASANVNNNTSASSGGYTNYTCPVFDTPGPDTSYIPHHKGNFWDYCSGNINVIDWTCKIVSDTMINNMIIFNEWYDFSTAHAAPQSYTVTIQIDSLGNYYSSSNIFIKPSANDGDTIYKNLFSGKYTRLVSKNDVFVYAGTHVADCYHTESGYLNGTNKSDDYYKKGIGLLNFNGILRSATIH